MSLETLQRVKSAYHAASAGAIARHVLRRARGVRGVAARLSFLLFIASAAWLAGDSEPSALPIVSVAICMFAMGFSFEWAVRGVYASYFSRYGSLIKEYRKNRQFLRFLIFREQLLLQGISLETALDLRPALVLSDDGFEKQILQHPFTVVLLGFLTAMLGGASSILPAWQSGLLPTILVFISVALFFNFQLIPLLETPAQRERELKRFLQWLAADQIQQSNNGLEPMAPTSGATAQPER